MLSMLFTSKLLLQATLFANLQMNSVNKLTLNFVKSINIAFTDHKQRRQNVDLPPIPINMRRQKL